MTQLQNAFDARNKKQNKIEKVKELKNPQEAFAQLEEYAKNGYASIPDEDKSYFLKCFGIYDRPATPERFMLKLRIPGGQMSALQANVIGACAKEFGQDYIDLTTRQQTELRYLRIEDLPIIMKRLEAVGIDGYQTGVDNIRSIMCDPLDDMALDNIIPAHKTLLKMQDIFLHNSEWISTLPRKFNAAITGSMTNRCNIFCHDASFALAQKDGLFGYNLYLGGKVGVVGKAANIFLKNEAEVLAAFKAIITIFKRFGFRDNRNKNRLHFLIESVGMQVIADAIREEARIDFAVAGLVMTNLSFNDSEQGKVQLRDGSFALHTVIPSGVFSGTALMEVARLSSEYGNGAIRLDMEQNLFIMGVTHVEKLLSENFFQTYKNINTPYLNHQIACAGTEHCPFGVIENKNDAIAMSHYLNEKVALENTKVRLYWSACVKGCGIHGLADIGFEGCKSKLNGVNVASVNITMGGKLDSEGVEGHFVLKGAPLEFAKYYVESIMLIFKENRLEGENYEKFYERVLSRYTHAKIGFLMMFNAYLRSKNIELKLGLDKKVLTGKNEEFEVFELGRRLYYHITKKEAYSSYERFTNVLKNEKLVPIQKVVPDIDASLAEMIDLILHSDERKRAVVFSELTPFIMMYSKI